MGKKLAVKIVISFFLNYVYILPLPRVAAKQHFCAKYETAKNVFTVGAKSLGSFFEKLLSLIYKIFGHSQDRKAIFLAPNAEYAGLSFGYKSVSWG